jgi:hypothetical protein
MADGFVPTLSLAERGDRCRLSLGGRAHGDGATMQEAADDLVARLLAVALRLRATGLGTAAELGPPDRPWLDFLWELGELASRGEDVRPRVLGVVSPDAPPG